jgi:hypothetical protein
VVIARQTKVMHVSKCQVDVATRVNVTLIKIHQHAQSSALSLISNISTTEVVKESDQARLHAASDKHIPTSRAHHPTVLARILGPENEGGKRKRVYPMRKS